MDEVFAGNVAEHAPEAEGEQDEHLVVELEDGRVGELGGRDDGVPEVQEGEGAGHGLGAEQGLDGAGELRLQAAVPEAHEEGGQEHEGRLAGPDEGRPAGLPHRAVRRQVEHAHEVAREGAQHAGHRDRLAVPLDQPGPRPEQAEHEAGHDRAPADQEAGQADQRLGLAAEVQGVAHRRREDGREPAGLDAQEAHRAPKAQRPGCRPSA